MVVSAFLVADTSGEYGFQMLKLHPTANSAGQAGLGAFSSGDALTFLTNPASAVLKKKRVLSLSQNFWIVGTNIKNLCYIYSSGKNSFGLGMTFVSYDEQDIRSDSGEFLGYFHPADINLAVNYGRRITPNHYVGLNLRGLYEKIYTASSIGYSVDFGYVYLAPIKGLKLAFAAKNFGDTSKMAEEKIELPQTLEISAIQKFTVGTIGNSAEIKVMKHIDDDELKAALGINSRLNRFLNFTIGYKINNDSETLSAGFGVFYNKFILDYAFVPLQNELNIAHYISLSYKL